MRARSLLLFMVIAVVFVTAGCWNRVEVEERALVMGSAIDRSPTVEGKLMVTTELANPADLISPLAGGGGGDTPSWVISSTGWTMFDAVRNFVMQTRRRLFWSHSQVIVIGEDMAREGIRPFIDFYIRDPELRRTSWMIVAKGTEGKEILNIDHAFGGLTSEALDALVQSSRISSEAVQVTLSDFVETLVCESCATVAGRVELINSDEEQEDGEDEENSEAMDGDLIRYTGGAVFKEEKLVGWLDRSEARGLNWIQNELDEGILVIECGEGEDRRLSIEIIFAESKMEVEFVDGKPVVAIEVEAQGNIGEVMCQQINASDYDQMIAIERRFAQVVRNEITNCLKKAQDLEADIIGLGKQIKISNHRQWSQLEGDWERVFSEIDFDIVVSADVRRFGLMNDTLEIQR